MWYNDKKGVIQLNKFVYKDGKVFLNDIEMNYVAKFKIEDSEVVAGNEKQPKRISLTLTCDEIDIQIEK